MEHWKDACNQLAEVTQAFCNNASDVLEIDSSRASTSNVNIFHLEANLTALDAELLGPVADSKRLDEGCAKLKVSSNISRRIIPINILPEDVLVRIFAIMVGWDSIYCDYGLRPYKIKDWTSYATILSSVNTAWRRIMINTASFWSHIDVKLGLGHWRPFRSHTLLHLQRAKSTPVELHLFCDVLLNSNDFDYQIPPLPAILRGRTVHSLNLIVHQSESVQPIIGVWLNTITPSQLTSLKVNLIFQSLDGIGTPAFSPVVPITEQLCTNLLQLRTLNLSAVHIDWNHARFSGLVDLELDFLHPLFCPSIEQLHSMLVASPKLCTLRLSSVGIRARNSARPEPIMPIKLHKLTFLGLNYLDSALMETLLQFIEPAAPGPLCLNVSYNQQNPEGMLRLLEPFCTQYKVTTLSLRMPNVNGKQLAQFLCSLKDLRTLNLSDTPLYGNAFINTLCARPETSSQEAKPQLLSLQCLSLLGCSIAPSGLRRIVSAHPICWLRLQRCYFYQDEVADNAPNVQRYFNIELPNDFVEWLENVIPELYVDHVHTTMHRSLPWWLAIT